MQAWWSIGIPNLKSPAAPIPEIWGSQNYKSRSRDVDHAPFDLVLHFWFVGLEFNPHTKFEVSGFTHSRDTEGVPKCKSRSRDLDPVSYTHLTLPTNREV